jgi:hypothetical protein
MNNNEKQFEDFVRGIRFDDTPDPNHRDRLERDLLAAMRKRPRQKEQALRVWRIIMRSQITKFAAAAAILIAVSVVGWFLSSRNATEDMSSFRLLSEACATEQVLFYGTGGIVYIVNEIILSPERSAGELLSDLESGTTKDKNKAFLKSWLSYRWFPVYSLGTDGKLREYKLELAGHVDKAVTVSDVSWYDSATGRFARVLKAGEQVLFANAYDGEFIYLVEKGPNGELQVEQEPIADGFHVPDNPADFLGIAAGIIGSIPVEHYPPIQNVTTETLPDGTPSRVYKLGFAYPWGKADTYFLFKINTDTDIIGEIECVADGKTTRIYRRIVAETVSSPELSWNLSELSAAPAEQSSADVSAREGAKIVTAEQMAQRATLAVYVFAENPSWIDDCTIYDLPDDVNKSARFFSATYRAKDGRDIVLTQGGTFTRYFSSRLDNFQKVEQVPWTYESENGFKAFRQDDQEGEMWWTEFALKSAGFEPRANRVGYHLMSPAKTFLVLAINGPVSEQELKELVDSLIPADEYVSSSVQP